MECSPLSAHTICGFRDPAHMLYAIEIDASVGNGKNFEKQAQSSEG